jgi:LEA14-like dessication related protein
MKRPFPQRVSARSSRGLPAVCVLAAVAACTPLGLWVYDDPGLEVSRVRVSRAASSEPVMLALAVWNPNDYDVSTARLDLQLKLDDLTVGRFSRDSVIPVPQAGLAHLVLPLMVPNRVRQRIRTLVSGTHRFAVEGRATFSTPFGPRKVRIAHQGDLEFGGANEARVATTIAADSLAMRQRRGIYAPRLPGVRPTPDRGPQPQVREPQAEPR